jgi:hypothetical protein
LAQSAIRAINGFPQRNTATHNRVSVLTQGSPFGLCGRIPCAVRKTDIDPEDFMSDFSDREKGFERKFAMDEELRFKANARRNKLLGLWAAEKLGKSGSDADAYATECVVADFAEAGDDDVLRKVKADFDAAGVEQSEHQIRRTMDELMARAVEQMQS